MAVEVSLDLMINFLEFVVIPSFGQPPPFTEGTRSEWMEMSSKDYEQGRILLRVLANVLDTKEEANNKLNKLQTRQSEERQQQQQTSKSSKSFPLTRTYIIFCLS
jgi:hypothetical protein